METWLPVFGFEKTHEVSNFGKIRRIGSVKPLATHKNDKGYYSVQLHCSGFRKARTLHSLVADTFICPRPEGMQVNHINGVKSDNCVDNLEWVTPSENMAHALRIGLRKKSYNHFNKGNRNLAPTRPQTVDGNYNAKLSEADAKTIISLLKTGRTCKSLANEFSVSKTSVVYIKTGKRWPHLPR